MGIVIQMNVEYYEHYGKGGYKMNLKTAKEVIEELQVTMESHMSSEEKMKLEVWLKEYYIDELIKKKVPMNSDC